MRLGKSIPPAAAPLSAIDLMNGCFGLIKPKSLLLEFKQSVCRRFGMKHCFFISSGKAAFTLTLRALSILHPERKQVVVPAFNCYSVPSAILRAGLTTLPCDVDAANLQFDRETLKHILKKSENILAVCPTHLFSLPEDVEQIKDLLEDHEVAVVEDSAQAMGSTFKGKLTGTNGDIGIFSLARGKAVSAGEGGIIITNDDQIASVLEKLISDLPTYSKMQLSKLIFQSVALTLLIHPYLFWLPKMLPFLKIGETIFDSGFPITKLSGFQAGLAKQWESKIDWLLKERSIRSNMYSKKLKGLQGITLITEQFQSELLSCIRFPIRIHDKNIVQKIIQQSDYAGLGISRTYPDAIDRIPEISANFESKCKTAKICAQTIITLPCHPMVNKRDIEKIIALIRSVLA